MARFLIMMYDPEDNNKLHAVIRAPDVSDAIILHPWIREIYKDEWIKKYVYCEGHEALTLENVQNIIGWICLCVNLDEEIMKDLNGGDSNVSSQIPQSQE